MIRQAFQLIVALAFSIGTPAVLAKAQPVAKMPRIGILVVSPRAVALPVEGFREGLRDLGYVEGRSVSLEWRYAEGRSDRLPVLAQELVGLNVDVIHAAGPDAGEAARRATSTIPIVVVGGRDPVAAGWAVSLARPGGNVTGLNVTHPGIPGKTLELLKEALPGISRVAVLADAATFPLNEPVGAAFVRTVEEAARQLNINVRIFEVRGPDEFHHVFAEARSWRAQALHMNETAMLHGHRVRLAELAAKERLPAIGVLHDMARAGFLLAYGPDVRDLHRRAAVYVDKILKGTPPGAIPFERPSKFALVINTRTAKALNLTLPLSLLLRADVVIDG